MSEGALDPNEAHGAMIKNRKVRWMPLKPRSSASLHSWLPKPTVYHLKIRAALEGRSQSSIVEDALSMYFKKFDDSKLMAYYYDHYDEKEGDE